MLISGGTECNLQIKLAAVLAVRMQHALMRDMEVRCRMPWGMHRMPRRRRSSLDHNPTVCTDVQSRRRSNIHVLDLTGLIGCIQTFETFNLCLKCCKGWHAQAEHCHPDQGQETLHGQISFMHGMQCWICMLPLRMQGCPALAIWLARNNHQTENTF